MFQFNFKRGKRQAETQCADIAFLSDNIVEADETFLARLSTDDPGVIIDPEDAVITIIDNDRKLQVLKSLSLTLIGI